MNFSTIAIIIIITTIIFYVSFLILGVSGITKNREAQGIVQRKKIDN